MTSRPTRHQEIIDELFQPVITNEENQLLVQIPTEEEIFEIVQSLNSWKAPGHDGFNAKFYKSAWPIIKHDIVKYVQDCFVGGKLYSF